jgi:alkylation response protein AidB-like acyl-CoA dehydrogenase
VDFTFSPEQEALRASVRSFLADKSPSSYVQAMLDGERGFSDEVWNGLDALGVVDLLQSGGELIDMVVVQEEMGRVPFPGPFFSAAVLAPLAARHLGIDVPPGRGTVALEEFGHGPHRRRTRHLPARRADRRGRPDPRPQSQGVARIVRRDGGRSSRPLGRSHRAVAADRR